ncbi:MAG: OadG family protein [Lachnospiraceae bacterium]|nr:OadG family protein [Lachnospiraceae bacterium]
MKNIKKALLALLLVVLAAFAMTGCGQKTSSQVEEEAQTAIRSQTIKDITSYTENNFVALLKANTYETYLQYINQGQTFVSIPFQNDFGYRWSEFVEKYGEVKDAVADTAERTDTGYSDRIILTGAKGDQMALTIVYDKTMTPVSTTIEDYKDDSKETLGSKMKTAAGNTVTGLMTVFIILVFLIFVISLFKFLPGTPTSGKKKDGKAAAPAPAVAPAPVAAPAPAAPAEEEELVNDEELAAVIAAAIAAYEDKPVEGYVVRSIKRLHNNKWR